VKRRTPESADLRPRWIHKPGIEHGQGWTGSTTTYYALYDAPLRSLENHPIGAVRRWAMTMLGHMTRQIEAAQTEEDGLSEQ
jgi:hypothetical protein